MIIREYDESDLSSCEKLKMKLWFKENGSQKDSEVEFGSGKDFSSCQLGWNTFVAEDKGQLIGFVETSIIKLDSVHNNPVGCIKGWYIDSNYRHKGLGKLLINEAENWVKYEGCTCIAISIGSDNEAGLELFKKLGYGIYKQDDESYILTKEIRAIDKVI